MEGAPRRERKVVSVVFCDLVGFTQRAETLDPEDVDAFLEPYHRRLRSELEHYGGTVEKFIGDAVMALFGAPTSHEDDPERAVRAALAIRDWAVESEDVEVRIGVTTGEALIRLDARPEAGEGMASGDVVNTAARVQAAAPTNEVLVDETTYRAIRHVIELEEADPVEAKGKSEAISVWRAGAARSRFGVDVAHEARTQLVGRERELSVLREAFERARHERIPQLVTLVGVPGIGKSRLVYELSRIAAADPDIITWRQGRCLAYGEGVTLWALGEIVKAQAGVVEQDPPEDVRTKMHDAVSRVLADSDDANWVESHLLALVGLSGASDLGGDRRGEAFAAWRRFLEALAERRPLVLVFEDLHWADESMLDFVDELVDWVTDVPLLVVATSRPELLERRPGWGGGKLNATTLALSPLSDEQTAFLIGQLVAHPVLEAQSQKDLLERAGGNPLYAEQYADLYLERGSADRLPIPETLHGLIAARLDALPELEKGVMQDASVVGKVFWASALHGVDDAAPVLHALERKGFVRRQRRSSVDGESEYSFAHALVRDVAYGQIARADRAAKHRRAAEWIEDLGRREEHAELLAYHWTSALELVRATGGADPLLSERARLALRDAGDRAFVLNSYNVAAAQFEDALELWPADAPDRPELLFRLAEALMIATSDRATDALTTARDALLSAGDRERAAEAEALLARRYWFQGDIERTAIHQSAADALIEGAPASPGVARVLAFSARHQTLEGEIARGLEVGRHALDMAESLRLEELRIHALTTIGSAKSELNDPTAEDDLRRAVELALAANSPLISGALNNLSTVIDNSDARASRDLQRQALDFALRFGDASIARFLRGNLITATFVVGDWTEVMEAADQFVAECESGSPHVLEGPVRESRGYIRVARGDVDAGLDDMRRALELARGRADGQWLLPGLVRFARANFLAGRRQEAAAAFTELLRHLSEAPTRLLWWLPQVGVDLDRRSAVREIIARQLPSSGTTAAFAILDGDFVRAAELYEAGGFRVFAADSRERAARELIESGRRAEGEGELEKALVFYRSVGASLLIRRAEELLAATPRAKPRTRARNGRSCRRRSR
jgi:class 3 adenylate cyclase/tetratricopeptide (TPR) repeat protein